MEVDKENWHPKTKTSKRHNLSRRRSTGIMKGGDSTGDLISPKAKKRSRIEMMNKRVSFGVVDVRLYEKDIDWTASPTEKKTARSVDVGSIPFNDGSPIATAPNSDKSMLRALCDDDDDDDDNEEQTMEMTVNHGRIIAQALSEKTNLSTLLDDDQSEGPGSPLTMDLTMNYSKIMQNKQENEDTMEMTVNHSKIVSADPVIIKVITSPSSESSQKCEGTKLETAVSPFEAGQKPCRRFLPSPKEGICFSISTPPDALKATPNDIDEFDLISPSHQSFIDNDQTSDLTRNIQHHIGSIVAGDDDDKTVELNRLTSQMTEHEAKVAMEFKRILNSDIEGDSTTNITVQLDSVDEFLSNIRSPEVASTAVEKPLKEPTKVEISPIRHPVMNSVDAFLSYGRIRFMDATNSTRKTLSVGFAPTNEPASEPERLHFACYHLPTLTNVQDSANQLSKICSTLSAEIKEMEDWLDSQAPDVFVKYLQKGDEKLFENLQQLKQACKLQSKIKWYQHRFRQEESLLAALKERTQQLRSDKKFIVEADTQIRDIMQQQRLNDGKLSVLRTAIEDQASKIDELNNDLEHLQKSESSLSSNLQNLQLAVQKQESLASKKELWRKDEVSLVAKSRDLFFLQACVDWRMSKCSETDLVLSFGSLCSITFQISGNGTGNILSAKFVRQTSGSEIWASLIKANEPKFNSILQQAGQVRQLPPLLKKFSLWLGRMRSLEMEIHKLMPIYTILVEPSPNDFLLNITICSSSPISSVTFTVQLDVEKFATNPVSLIEIRLLHGPDNLGQHIRDIIASAQGFGSLSKICSEVSSRLSMQPSVCA